MAYNFDGVEYPSVTTITSMLNKPMLLGWAASCAVDHIKEHLHIIQNPIDVHRVEDVLEAARTAYEARRKEAASAGTQVHNAIEAYIRGDVVDGYLKCDEARTGFNAFLSWESKNHVEWLESEVEVVCVSIGYAGRFDAIAIVNGHRYLIDFKTSKDIYPEMPVQLCGYRQAYNEMFPNYPVDNLAILHLDKEKATPTFKPVENEIERKTIFFNYLVSAYYFQCNRNLKNNPFVEAAKSWGTVPF
jgi:hypothetical protein